MLKYDKAIISTLCYAFVFKYPLVRSQIWRFLIWDSKHIPKFSLFIKSVDLLVKRGKAFFIKGEYILLRTGLWVDNKLKAEKVAVKKIKIAQNVVNLLSKIPSVEFIGLSGKLAMRYADKDDDIDLLIIVQKDTLWITRIIILTLLYILGHKRSPFDKDVSNKICVNMIIDNDNLALPFNERDLFSAHEIAQIKPLFSKNNCYSRFIKKNIWVKFYLPNSIGESLLSFNDQIKLSKMGKILSLFNNLTMKFQLWYMRNKRTNEVVRKGYVRFHPRDARNWILPEYNKLLKKFQIPITKFQTNSNVQNSNDQNRLEH